MADSEVVYTPTRNDVTFEVEYFNDRFYMWENAEGDWTFQDPPCKIKSTYHAEEPAREIADLLAYNGYEARVVKYVNAQNKEDY